MRKTHQKSDIVGQGYAAAGAPGVLQKARVNRPRRVSVQPPGGTHANQPAVDDLRLAVDAVELLNQRLNPTHIANLTIVFLVQVRRFCHEGPLSRVHRNG